jgi:hypothetical protein
MKKLLFTLLLLLLAIVIVYFALPFFQPLRSVAFDAVDRDLLAAIPEEAQEVYIVPRLASFVREARNHPFTRDAVERLDAEIGFAPLLIGNAAVVYWRHDDDAGFVARLDPLRMQLVKLYLQSANADVYMSGALLSDRAIGRGGVAAPDARVLAGAGEGHVFLLYPKDRPAFPPVGRPLLASGNLEAKRAVVRAAGLADVSRVPTAAPAIPLPQDAPLIGSVGAAPEWLGDFDELLGIDLRPLLARGFAFALYDVASGSLTLQPKIVLAVPGDVRSSIEPLQSVSGAVSQLLGRGKAPSVRSIDGVEIRSSDNGVFAIESGFDGTGTLLSFDRSSMERFLASRSARSGEPSRWWLASRPEMLIPVLERLKDNRLIRVVARDFQRDVNSFLRSLRYLKDAERVEMSLRPGGEVDLLDVVVVSK